MWTSVFHMSTIALMCSLLCSVATAAPGMRVSSFDGIVTGDELKSFNGYVAVLQPATDNIHNNWAQGHSGEELKAMGVVYQISGDKIILDKMVQYCDAVLSQRNDLAPAPVGQRQVWTGDIAPVWPNADVHPVTTGGEQGDPVGHLANCANLILQDKTIYTQKVAGGDKYKFGATYLDRAKRYVKEADFAMTTHILGRLLDLSSGQKMYFASDSPYKGGGAVPWNQQMMFNYAFQGLVEAHAILKDNDKLAAQYRRIMSANLSWFFSGGGSRIQKSTKGNPIYDWEYAFGTTDQEDSNHGSLDVAGFYRAYATGNWSISAEQMKPFANVLIDSMTLGKGQYAGKIDGSCGDDQGNSKCTNYIRSGWLLTALFRPDKYKDMMAADLKEGGIVGKIDIFSRFLWVKYIRSSA